MHTAHGEYVTYVGHEERRRRHEILYGDRLSPLRRQRSIRCGVMASTHWRRHWLNAFVHAHIATNEAQHHISDAAHEMLITTCCRSLLLATGHASLLVIVWRGCCLVITRVIYVVTRTVTGATTRNGRHSLRHHRCDITGQHTKTSPSC